MLTLGLLAYHVLSFIPVPYTALLLVRSLASSPQSHAEALPLLTGSRSMGVRIPSKTNQHVLSSGLLRHSRC